MIKLLFSLISLLPSLLSAQIDSDDTPRDCMVDSIPCHPQGGTGHQSGQTQFSRPISQIYMLEIGGASALDTYLSPLRYHGGSVALSGQWCKALPWQENRWTMSFDARVGISSLLNPPGNARMLSTGLTFSWEAARRFTLPSKLSFTTGFTTDLNAGVLYLPRNSNNPASAKASLGIALTASMTYPFKMGKVPVLISDRIHLPSLSAFFSPAYGESYYEIYLGNHSGLAHCGWWGNHFGLDNLLAFDLDLGPSAFRLGYRFSLQSSWINHINTQLISNAFVIGWIPNGLGLRKTTPPQKAITINALY